MNSYSIQRKIPKWGKNTFVNWSLSPQNKAIVFIHGFNGSSMDTFGDFNLDFRYRPEYEGYDVYFFSYGSMFKQIANSALRFLDFLKSIHDNLKEVMRDSGIRENRLGVYSKIVIIGHSLGAVVARQALNDGYDAKETWLNKCELIFFAPAHIGARPEIMSFINFPSFLKCLGPFTKYVVVTLNQLTDPSIIIGPMTEKCRELIEKKGITTFTIAKKIIWADDERVVQNRKFLQDPNAIILLGGHTTVCKPHTNFDKPFIEVAPLL